MTSTLPVEYFSDFMQLTDFSEISDWLRINHSDLGFPSDNIHLYDIVSFELFWVATLRFYADKPGTEPASIIETRLRHSGLNFTLRSYRMEEPYTVTMTIVLFKQDFINLAIMEKIYS